MFDYPFIPDLPQWMEILGLGIIATIIGAVLVALTKRPRLWVWYKMKSTTRSISRLVARGIKLIFTWIAGEVREWQRVSNYRHRFLTWDDLPQGSKDTVTISDLSQPVRDSIKLQDVSQMDKYYLIHKFILPSLNDSSLEGIVYKLDDNDRRTNERRVQIIIPEDDFFVQVCQNTMLLPIVIDFLDPTHEIEIATEDRILLRSELRPGTLIIKARIREYIQQGPGKRCLKLLINTFHYQSLTIYEDQ